MCLTDLILARVSLAASMLSVRASNGAEGWGGGITKSEQTLLVHLCRPSNHSLNEFVQALVWSWF